MTDILDELKSYLDDPAVVMSKRVVGEAIVEIERLRAELAAERGQKVEAMAAVIRAVDMKIEAEAERDDQKRRADYLSKDFDRDIKLHQAEEDKLRTDLAAARAEAEEGHRALTLAGKTNLALMEACEKYAADLAAARELLAASRRWVKGDDHE